MIPKIKDHLKFIQQQVSRIAVIERFLENDLKSPKINLGQIQSNMNAKKESVTDLSEVEFQVFSQWGDDGIIQYMVNKLNIPNKTFIEFGVENYRESNTRFLLINNNWTGLVIDGSPENVEYIKKDIICWACELYAEASFITAENINDLLARPGFGEEIGILSVDIDGNDYWVWKAITNIKPVIVIAEYNSIFGKNTFWTIPYDPGFVRKRDHTITYYGASLQALCMLADEKGYEFVGCNSKGNNAYFIRKDKMVPAIQKKSPEEGYVLSKFREAELNGERVTGKERLRLLTGLKVRDLKSNKIINIDPANVEY
jgi:hypothetical protein